MHLADVPVRDVRPLLAEERAALLDLLRGLSRDQWEAPSPCPAWLAKDVAAHVLGEDYGVLARGRDGHLGERLGAGGGYRALVADLNAANERWVVATRRLSSRQLVALLAATGGELADFWAAADLAAPARVLWAGPEPVPAWFDLARHFTERWVHQQQIREAVGRPGLAEERFLGEVLRTFAWALPHHYRGVPALPGTTVGVTIAGPGGGEWSLTRTAGGWELEERPGPRADARVELSDDAAWRLFTDSLDDAARVERRGPAELTEPFLTARAIIV